MRQQTWVTFKWRDERTAVGGEGLLRFEPDDDPDDDLDDEERERQRAEAAARVEGKPWIPVCDGYAVDGYAIEAVGLKTEIETMKHQRHHTSGLVQGALGRVQIVSGAALAGW